MSLRIGVRFACTFGMNNRSISLSLAVGLLGAGCMGPEEFGDASKDDTSSVATFVDMEFQGTILTERNYGAESYLEDHLLYTIGHLNGDNSVGRIDKMEILAKDFVNVPEGFLFTYKVRLPVAWGDKNNVPSSYEFTLPKSVSPAFLERFTTSYKSTCVDWSAHDVDAGSMWYYYRPQQANCKPKADDVYKTTATVTRSAANTTGKYPEYNKVWEDNTLNVLAIFGKYEDGAKTASDSGIAAYNDFTKQMRQAMAAHGAVTSVPSTVPANPGIAVPDVSFSVTLSDGRKMNVAALLTDNISVGLSQPAFRARYEALTERADFIAYNGHAGLGTNVRALARGGRWVQGQYVMVFVNGCDTFAYVDTALNDAHAAVNADDPNGTKYIDIIMNAMPAFFASMANATTVFVEALLGDPQTYQRIFDRIDRDQVALVQGEEDNTYTPGSAGGAGQASWDLDVTASLASGAEKSWTSPMLAAGDHTITMTGTGDADLYVRVGRAPTATKYDCRPYLSSSDETCKVNLPSAGKLYVKVKGYAATNEIQLQARN